MLPNELPVSIGGSTAYYTLQSLVDGRSTRRDRGETVLACPKTLTFARSITGKGNKAIDSYLMRFDHVVASEQDANSYVQSTNTLSVYLVVKVPSGMSNGKSEASKIVTALRTLLNSTVGEDSSQNVQTRWLNGEL